MGYLNLMTRTCTNIVEISSYTRITCVFAPPARQHGTDEIWLGLEDGNISCWEIAPNTGAISHEVISWKGHRAALTQLQSSRCCGEKWLRPPTTDEQSKRWLVSASEDRSVSVWTPDDGRLLWEFYGHGGGILSLTYAPRERLLWSGSRDHSVRSWCLEDVGTTLREQEMMSQADSDS